jgi:hypothetical protein
MESRLRTAAHVIALLAVLELAAVAGPHVPPVDDGASSSTVSPTTADDWMKLGLERYESGDFKGAVDAFLVGNGIDPRPAFLFAIAQAERRRGNCKASVVYYQRFLATGPAEEQAAAARQQKHRCEGALIASAPRPEPVPEPPPKPAPAPPPPPPPAALPWWHDPIADAALGGTVLLGVGGIGLFVAAEIAASQAVTADTYDQSAMLRDRADTRRLEAMIVLGAGAVTAGVAVWRLLFHDRHPARESAVGIRVEPGPGLGLALGGQF